MIACIYKLNQLHVWHREKYVCEEKTRANHIPLIGIVFLFLFDRLLGYWSFGGGLGATITCSPPKDSVILVQRHTIVSRVLDSSSTGVVSRVGPPLLYAALRRISGRTASLSRVNYMQFVVSDPRMFVTLPS